MKLFKKLNSATCNFIINNPYKCLILFGLLMIISIPGLFRLETNFTYKAWYNDNDPEVQAFNDFEKKFGNDDNIIVMITHESGVINNETIKITRELIDRVWKIKDIFRIESLFTFNQVKSVGDDLLVNPFIDPEQESFTEDELSQIRKNIKEDPLVNKYLVGRGQKSLAVQAFLRPAFKTPTDHALVTTSVMSVLSEYRKTYPKHEFYLTGSATVVEAFKSGTINDIKLLTPILYTIFMIILWFRFRNVSSLIMTFSVITLSTLLMFSLMGYSLFQINTMSAACLTILLTVAISDAVHILSSYKYGISKFKNPYKAVQYSLEKNFYPTLLTSLTTAYGFASFGGAKVKPIATMGLSVAGGVILAWIVTYFFLGPMLLIIGRKQIRSVDEEDTPDENPQPSKKTLNYVTKINRYKYPILIITIISGILGFYTSTKLVVDMNPVEQFKKDHRLVVAYNKIAQEMNFSSIIDMVVYTNDGEVIQEPTYMNKVDRFQTWLNEQDYINSSISILDILKRVNKSLNGDDPKFYSIPETRKAIAQQLLFYTLGLPQGQDLNDKMSIDNKSLRISFNWNAKNSQDSRKYFKVITQKAKDFGLRIKITGKTPLFHELTPYVVKTFFESFIIAFIGITIIMIFALQSFKLGFLALVPNIFPLIIGAAIYQMFGQTVDMGTVIIASVCLGIAVDDSIHFLFEYQKYSRMGHDSFKSIANIVTTTFSSLFLTTLLITVGFSSFVVGNYIPNVKFGVMVAIILVIALIADFVILPAILLITERKKS